MSENKINVPEGDQAVALGEDLHCYEVFAGTLHGPDGRSKFMEDCETKEEDQKLQGHCADIGDVEMVRVLCYFASGKRKRA